MKREPLNLRDVVYGEDGEAYHIPTLLRLNTLGKLDVNSPGWRALMAWKSKFAPIPQA